MSFMVITCWRPLQWGVVGTCPLGNRTVEAFSEFGLDGSPWVGVLQLDDHVTNVDNNNNNKNLYCALDTKSVKTLKRNNCDKKRESTTTQKWQELIALSGWAMRKSN